MESWSYVLGLIQDNWLGLISALVALAAWHNASRSASVNVGRFRQEQAARKKADVVVTSVERPTPETARVVVKNAGLGNAINLRAVKGGLSPDGFPKTGSTLPAGIERTLTYRVKNVSYLKAALEWTNPDGTVDTVEAPLVRE